MKSNIRWMLLVILALFLSVILLPTSEAKRSKRPSANKDDKSAAVALPNLSPNTKGLQDKDQQLRPTVRTATKFDVSPPLRSMKPILTVGKQKGDDDRGMPGPVNDTRHDPDPVVQSWAGSGVFSQNDAVAIPSPSPANFDGMFQASGPTPPDPNGEIGPNHYVQMVNVRFQIFSRTGVSLFGPANINTLWAGFGGPCQVENAGDPIVVYAISSPTVGCSPNSPPVGRLILTASPSPRPATRREAISVMPSRLAPTSRTTPSTVSGLTPTTSARENSRVPSPASARTRWIVPRCWRATRMPR